MTLSLRKIEEAAREATPGPWMTPEHRLSVHRREAPCNAIACTMTKSGSLENHAANAAHIANMDPATVLALVAVVEAAIAAAKPAHTTYQLQLHAASMAALREALKPFNSHEDYLTSASGVRTVQTALPEGELRAQFEAYILARNNNDSEAIRRDRAGDYAAHGVHCAWEAITHFADELQTGAYAEGRKDEQGELAAMIEMKAAPVAWRWRWVHSGSDAPWKLADYEPDVAGIEKQPLGTLAGAVERATLAERERCAKLADSYKDYHDGYKGPFNDAREYHRARADAGHQIAAAIRKATTE